MRVINNSKVAGGHENNATKPQKGRTFVFKTEEEALKRFPESQPEPHYGAFVVRF